MPSHEQQPCAEARCTRFLFSLNRDNKAQAQRKQTRASLFVNYGFICWTLTDHGVRMRRRKKEAFGFEILTTPCGPEVSPTFHVTCRRVRQGRSRRQTTTVKMTKPSGSIKCRQFLDELRDHRLLKRNIFHGIC